MSAATTPSEASSLSKAAFVKLWAARLYVPAITLVLLICLGGPAAKRLGVDPLTAAQNPRVRLQMAGDVVTAPPIGFSKSETELADRVLRPISRVQPNHPAILYLGNSQTYVIMDWVPGDLSSAQWLQILISRRQALDSSPIELHSGSLPGITMTEYLIRLVDVLEHVPQTKVVILQTALFGFRGIGVRPEVVGTAKNPEVRSKLTALVEANPDLSAARAALVPYLNQPSSDRTSQDVQSDTAFAKLEHKTQEELNRFPLFASRLRIRARFGLEIYYWRNRLLGLKTSTARPIVGPSYQASLQLVELAMRYSQSKGVHTIVYLAPIRPIEPSPEVPADVERYRRELPDLCGRYQSPCLDLTQLIPDRLWTNYTGGFEIDGNQPDFAHFTGPAHKVVAEAIFKRVGTQLLNWTIPNMSARR